GFVPRPAIGGELGEGVEHGNKGFFCDAASVDGVGDSSGKQGSVTGFTGAVTYAIDRRGITEKPFVAMFYALTQLAPYCGTGHKTTFGLGETQLGWHTSQTAPQAPTQQRLLAERMDELTEIFLSTKKRQGGRRAIDTAETWATILARREMGDPLQEIADDMELAYETAKTYSKLARRTMRELTRREYDG
ncbi:MAG: CRISPR system precrRNA processing endoribonuclease RAMP protein Cas6, partial [Cyanobacteria bacterium P01_D01_bin.56]